MSRVEGLVDEVMAIIERSGSGIDLRGIYVASTLAASPQAVAGAVHRLRSRGLLLRGTDKLWRTPDQARQSAVPEAPAPAKRVVEQADVAQAPVRAAQEAEEETARSGGDHAEQVVNGAQWKPPISLEMLDDLKQASSDARRTLSRYLDAMNDPLLERLMEVATAADAAVDEALARSWGASP